LTIPGPCGSLTGMPSSRSRRVLAAAAIVLLAAVFWLKGRTAMADFEVNYRAGGRLLAGETLYRTTDQHWQFKYSPFSALLYLPLSFLPLPAAKAIWFGLVAAATAAVILLSRRALGTASPPSAWAAGLAAAVLARFFLRELQLGQINAVITVLLLIMILELRPAGDRWAAGEIRAGIFWGLATALKPYAVIFLPYFLLKRKFRALLTGLGIVAVSLAVPVVFYGPAGLGTVLGEWAQTLSRSTPGLFDTQDNVSLMGLLTKWTGDIGLAIPLFAGLTALLALLTLAAVLKGRAVSDPLPLDAGLLLLFIPLLSPLGWDYTFLSAYLALLVVFDRWNRFSRPVRAVLALASALIGLAAYDLLGRTLYASYMAASIPTLCFLVVTAALFQLRRAGEA
jgi:alpha-1,2-mannosyltransferase